MKLLFWLRILSVILTLMIQLATVWHQFGWPPLPHVGGVM
jgi:hypothetical protein